MGAQYDPSACRPYQPAVTSPEADGVIRYGMRYFATLYPHATLCE